MFPSSHPCSSSVSILLLLFTHLLCHSPYSAFPINRIFPLADPEQLGNPSILITVKTTAGNHQSRVRDAMDTWASGDEEGEEGQGPEKTARTNILFITDSMSPPIPVPSSSSAMLIPSSCPTGHTNAALCCKMGVELRMALDHGSVFWCHFDDDNFVLLRNLRALLARLSPLDDLYLGAPSTSAPVRLPLGSADADLSRPFWFGTGGAGLCLSASALGKMRDFVAPHPHQFEQLCAELGVPDDVTLGFILANLLHIPLTPVDKFHSHLDPLDAIPRAELADQITLSGSWPTGTLVNVPELIPRERDLLRFHSLHRFIRNQRRESERRKR